jgi:hypothetical protein
MEENRTRIDTVGKLKQLLSNIPDDAKIVMYNERDEGDCFAEAATYYAPGEQAKSDYCQGDSVLDEICEFENRTGVVVMFG